MKKTYNSPKVLVVLLDTQDMICGSELKAGGTTSNESDLLSRERRDSFWDDEEE